jgi:uncharacterized membrane protein YgcG
MHTQSHRCSTPRNPVVRRLSAAALCISLIALLAAIPTVPASARSTTAAPSFTLPASVSGLPTSEVEKLLSEIPLASLNATQLTELLSKLPGLGGVEPLKLKEALTTTIEGLVGKGATLGQLTNPAEVLSTLEAQLNKLLSVPELLSLLKGQSLTTVLTGALGSLNPSQVLGSLLSSASKPEQLIGQVLATLNPEKLQTLLGTTLTSEPFAKTTVGELAGSLGTTVGTLASAVGRTAEQLPGTAMALTAPLTNGKTLGALNSLGGLSLSLLGSSGQEKGSGHEGGGSGSATGSSGSQGSGGSGGSGGAPGGTTLVVNNPLARQTAAAGSGSKAAGKIRILSHRVKGRVATIVVQVPAAGKLALVGSGVRSVRREAANAERVTLRAVLTRAGVTSLRRRHNRLRVKLKASFKQTSGPSSSATVTVNFA